MWTGQEQLPTASLTSSLLRIRSPERVFDVCMKSSPPTWLNALPRISVMASVCKYTGPPPRSPSAASPGPSSRGLCRDVTRAVTIPRWPCLPPGPGAGSTTVGQGTPPAVHGLGGSVASRWRPRGVRNGADEAMQLAREGSLAHFLILAGFTFCNNAEEHGQVKLHTRSAVL